MIPSIQKKLKFLLSALVLSSALIGSMPVASADAVIINRPGSGSRPMMLDLHAGFIYYGYGPSIGARFSIPIVRQGFLPMINNTVAITFGGDFYWIRLNRDHYAAGVGFPVTLQWRFLFTQKLSAFGEIGVNLFLHPDLIACSPEATAPSVMSVFMTKS